MTYPYPTREEVKALMSDIDDAIDVYDVLAGDDDPLYFWFVRDWYDQADVKPLVWEQKLFAVNLIMQQHGIEHLVEDGKTIASYVNTGETYQATVLYDHTHERFVISSWGDFFEQWQTANIIEVGLRRVANDVHAISHAEWISWEERVDGNVEDYTSAEEWLGSASIDLRLRVTEGSGYEVLFGSPDFDTDHRGAWGSVALYGSRRA